MHHHVYAQMSELAPRIMCSSHELRKVHRQFSHASAESLVKLLRTASREKLTPETYQNLQEISRICDPCQRIANASLRFRVSMGSENLRFNETLFIDVVYIDNRPVLHLVDSATHFWAARFLADMKVKTFWCTIVVCWALLIGLDTVRRTAHVVVEKIGGHCGINPKRKGFNART